MFLRIDMNSHGSPSGLQQLGGTHQPEVVSTVKNKPRFSLVLPCFDEAASIKNTIAELRRVLHSIENYELIIVDDGSKDGSGKILEEERSLDPSLRVLRHSPNQGYGAALKTGIRAAVGEFVFITDADGTYPLDRIPELLEMAGDFDMVVGARTADDVQHTLIRKIPKALMRAYAQWITRQHIPDLNSGMRVFRRSIVERFLNILPDGFSFTTTITIALMANRYRVGYIPISYAARIGKSKIKPIRDTLAFFQLILRTGMYFAPLRVYGPVLWIMFVAFITSLGYDVFVIQDLTEKTLLLMILFITSTMFALLADMLDKRSQ
jgi:glycosyltransferase involved in cell wall biosynthesis